MYGRMIEKGYGDFVIKAMDFSTKNIEKYRQSVSLKSNTTVSDAK